MNLKWIALSGVLGVTVIVLACTVAAHSNSAGASTPFIALSSVAVPEIPAKAAELVHAAAPLDRERTVREVLRDVSAVAKPGVLRYVVSAVCGSNPEMAGPAVATAIELQPEDVEVICQAALCAAPHELEQIVFSACRTAPGSCATVAIAAYRQAPSATEMILTTLARAMPELELYLEEAQMKTGVSDFQTVIDQTVQLYNEASKARIK
jgi:hypothetical protein